MLQRMARKIWREFKDYRDLRAPLGAPARRGPFAYGWLNLVYRRLERRAGRKLRPGYTFGALHGAYLASRLGLPRISLVEFGVAGGSGLLALERTAELLEEAFELEVSVYGFDTGVGLPKGEDHRDLPNLWSPGDYAMDVEALRKRLKRARLILGPVQETLEPFLSEEPAPVAFVSFDLDLYSSTVPALKLLLADAKRLLPRVHCFFDDILGFTYSAWNGERLALAEFNQQEGVRKISPIHGLKYYVPKSQAEAPWVEKVFMAHLPDHPLYAQPDGLVLDAHFGLGQR